MKTKKIQLFVAIFPENLAMLDFRSDRPGDEKKHDRQAYG